MKLVEIKNSLAKLFYEPNDFPLAISDFLTIDDGNQKILSQVVSIESTAKPHKNCAVLKFSLDLGADNSFSAYGGYVPALDSLVSKTNPTIIEKILSPGNQSVRLGQLTNETKLIVKLNSNILEKFLYIQSDRVEETHFVFDKIIDTLLSEDKKILYIDTDNLYSNDKSTKIELGKDFKLPVDNDTLNYIYENDLSELKIEEKTIVQDIILEIQEYINSLDEKFIPFNTLLDVVNQIYETDKSTGVILFRNKLIKYNQYNIFASEKSDFDSLEKIIENNNFVTFDITKANENWQKESINFVQNRIKTDIHLIMNVDDEITDKKILAEFYHKKNFKPIIVSSYSSIYANQLKSYAKDIILFRPEEKQKIFASYNSFMTKLAADEFIISGESTFYTPLILKPVFDEEIEKADSQQIIDTPDAVEIEADGETEHLETEVITTDENISEDTLEDLSDGEDLILEETELEDEIAKDVDEFFYADNKTEETETLKEEIQVPSLQDEKSDETENDEELDELLSDEELDLLDEFNEEESLDEQTVIEEITPIEDKISESKVIQPTQNILADTEEDFSSLEEITDYDVTGDEEPLSDLDLIPDFDTSEDFGADEQNETMSFLTSDTSNIPIYTTELDENISANEPAKIAEGNIVYHAKYGKGVVEQLITYGQKTLCSIQFDNVGRRLLDPSLADLKQM